jgi:light-regulated signal transduction histidine kinase (bacteriophytochrome)
LLDNGARRMRALTGYDRATLVCGGHRAESSRGGFDRANAMEPLPAIIADVDAPGVPLFPRRPNDSSAADALMHTGDSDALARLREQGVHASLRVPFAVDGISGEFRCDSRAPREPCFELHAAAELFAQLFAMRLEIDRLRHH